MIGGPGHLNGTPSNEFRNRFLASLLNSEFENLLEEATLIGLPWSTPQSIRTEIDWEDVYLRASEQKTEDMNALLEKINNQGIETKSDARLMVLSLLSDRELDPNAFLKGLMGSENVCWYFGRFLEDANSYQEKLAVQLSGKTHSLDLGEDSDLLDPIFHSVERFRFEYFDSIRRRRPEQFVRYLRQLVSKFYGYYNRPEFRALVNGVGQRNLPLRARTVTTISRCMVEKGLGALGLSCDTE